jgi:REP element-mobilizing transposase RayT
LDRVWIDPAVYFITTCAFPRHSILATPAAAAILIAEWESAFQRRGWNVSRYVIMPDHVHFFCTPREGASSLEIFVGKWKEWTAKRLIRELNCARPVWQLEFSDHLIRSERSCAEKWNYVYQNPVRAGLVAQPEDWPYSGEIVADDGL